MRKKFLLSLDLQYFADELGSDTGVETASAAEVQGEGTNESANQTGVEGQAAAEPEKQNNFEKAFAKRLADAKSTWEAETAEKYKGHDDFKFLAEYLQQANNNMDVMSLKERIELDRLQERAEQANVPPEVLKRIDELEAKAAKADEFEKQQAQEKGAQEFEQGLKDFAADKQIDGSPVDHMELWKYMYENDISKPDVAFKAMKAEVLEAKLETAKKDAINEYLGSKRAPKAEGSGTPGMTTFKPTGNLDAASERALARFRASRQSS